MFIFLALIGIGAYLCGVRKMIMETFFSLLILTVIYSLVILSVFPERYLRKLSHRKYHKEDPEINKFSLSAPLFFSFLLGYTFAATMLYFVIV